MKKHKMLDEINLIDDVVLKIFEWYRVIKPRIEIYFDLINIQTEFCNQIKSDESSAQLSKINIDIVDKVSQINNFPDIMYKSILGKIPTYALKDIAEEKIIIPYNNNIMSGKNKKNIF